MLKFGSFVVPRVKALFVKSAAARRGRWCPNYFIFVPATCECIWADTGVPATQGLDQEGVPGCQLSSGLALAMAAFWAGRQQLFDSSFLELIYKH